MSTNVIGPVQMAGSGGSSHAFLKGWPNGQLVQQITVWVAEERIKAIRFYMWGESNEQAMAHQYGSPDDYGYQAFKFEQGEFVTTMSLWAGNWDGHAGTRAGYISFNTSLGNSFNVGGAKSGSAVVVDVYSGWLVGAELWYGADINRIGFAFLRQVISATIKDVVYPANLVGALSPETLDSLNETNNSSIDLNWSLEGSKTVEISSSWSTSDSLSFGMSVSVTAGIPEISTTVGTEWQVGSTTTTSQTYTASRQLTWSQSGVLEPGESINIKAMTYYGSINVPYSGTMAIVVVTGSNSSASLEYPVNGTYEGVSVSEVEIVAE